MKHIYPIILACAATAFTANAQSKIDPMGRIMLKKIGTEKVETTSNSALSRLRSAGNYQLITTSTPLSTIVELNDGFTASDLEAAGYKVTTDLNGIAIVQVTASNVEKMAELDCVRRISIGRRLKPLMDVARQAYGINAINSGEFTYGGTQHKFTGKGVCTGIYDVGIEPNHFNFLDDEGNSRVKQFSYYHEGKDDNGNPGIFRMDIAPEDVPSINADTEQESHGTHTAGIMAGGYNGIVKYVNAWPENGSWGSEVVEVANPYKGIATESDILMACGVLLDATSIDGFNQMAKYAYDNGQPCVINYSVGAIMGPHDGTDPFSKAVSEVAKQYGAIFCVAAGNDGGSKICITKECTATDKSFKTCVTPNPLINEDIVQACVDIWSSDNRPFTVTVNSLRPKANALVKKQDTKLFTIAEAGADINISCLEGYGVYNSTLASHFGTASSDADGLAQIIATSEVDENNGRYHVMIDVITKRGPIANSYIYINVEGLEGQKIDANLNDFGELTAQTDAAGSIDGDDHNSVSDIACSPDVISVGATYNRQYRASLGGSIKWYDTNTFNAGAVAPFSSYGMSGDGRQLPEVVAPGADIVSSYNKYFVNYCENKDIPGNKLNDMSALATKEGDGETAGVSELWGVMSGTSMSSPFVAGTIALWLEADPTLTLEDIRQIIVRTSTFDAALEGSEHQAGAGRIDPTKGLIEILKRNVMSIEDVNGDEDRNLIITQNGNNVEVFFAGETSLTASIFNTQGAEVAKVSASDSTVTINTAALAPGIYILRVQGATGKSAARKIVVK